MNWQPLLQIPNTKGHPTGDPFFCSETLTSTKMALVKQTLWGGGQAGLQQLST